MLCNEMPRAGVQAPSEEATHDQVYERPWAVLRHEEVVEDHLGDNVEEMPPSQPLRANKRWSEGVEENLECPWYMYVASVVIWVTGPSSW